MTRSDLPSGLKAYAEEVATVLSFMPTWIDEDAYDAKAFSANLFGIDRSKPCNAKPLEEGSYILWTMNCSGPYFEGIGLVQELVRHGLVQRRFRNGKAYYKAKKA